MADRDPGLEALERMRRQVDESVEASADVVIREIVLTYRRLRLAVAENDRVMFLSALLALDALGEPNPEELVRETDRWLGMAKEPAEGG